MAKDFGCRLNPTQPTWGNFIPRLPNQLMVTLNILAHDGERGVVLDFFSSSSRLLCL